MKTKGIPKFVIYLLLIIFTSVPLFFSIPVPGQPVDASADAFKALMNLKEGDEVLLASDWTGSTRGEKYGSHEVHSQNPHAKASQSSNLVHR